MRISKYDREFTWEHTLTLAAHCVQMGIYEDFSDIFKSLPKTEFCRISGMDYSRVKLLCKKPHLVRDQELQLVLDALPGCSITQVRMLFGLESLSNGA